MRVQKRSLLSLFPLSLPGLLLLGCEARVADPADAPPALAEDSAETVRYAAATPEIRVRADDLTLWIDEFATQTVRGGTLQVAVKGRTSSNLASVLSTVPDDAFGQATLIGPRSFSITLRDGHEINTILSGLPLFVTLKLSNGKTYGAKFSLSTKLNPSAGPVSVDPSLRPIYFRDTTNLRYRGFATTTASGLAITSRGGTPPWLGSPAGSRYPFDWEFSGLATLLDASTDQVVFATGTGASSTQQASDLRLVVREVGLGIGDPAVRWPTPACARTTYDCIAAIPASQKDLSACGLHREVSRCIGVDLCDVVPTPVVTFALREKDASPLSTAVKAAHDACPRTGGSWCSVGPAWAFDYPRCVSMTPTQAQINEAALAETDRSGVYDVRYGHSLTRAELLLEQTFKRGLLTSIDAFAGDTNVSATRFESEEPCHNCHQFSLKYVLFYPRTQTVVVIDGSHGYDS
ncbi:MAG TPA: hypothetical protein PKE31_03570 [Pseudomonadota bacterium]|nr:hypothetical protein [Pseudomonadota bacterium]